MTDTLASGPIRREADISTADTLTTIRVEEQGEEEAGGGGDRWSRQVEEKTSWRR